MAKKKSGSKKRWKKYKIELTKLSIFLWGFCFFFLLGWIFVLGILVGQGFLPTAVTTMSDLKDQISKLQEMISHNRSNKLRSQKRSHPGPELDFYEKLSSKKDEAKKKKPPDSRVKVSKKARSKKEILATQKVIPDGKKKKVIEIKGKRPKPSESATHFTVQIASLEDKSNADKMVSRLLDRGYPAYFYEVMVKGKTYYRIRSGRFVNREEAKKHAGRLVKKEGIKGFVSKLE